MTMTRALRLARRWLGWIHYTDRVAYWRRQAHQNADAEKTMRHLRDVALGNILDAVEDVRAATTSAAALGDELETTRHALAGAKRRVRGLEADLAAAAELATAHRDLIEKLGAELAASGQLADMTPALRARTQAAQEAALRAVDPARAGGGL
jgi:hypothetical protein